MTACSGHRPEGNDHAIQHYKTLTGVTSNVMPLKKTLKKICRLGQRYYLTDTHRNMAGIKIPLSLLYIYVVYIFRIRLSLSLEYEVWYWPTLAFVQILIAVETSNLACLGTSLCIIKIDAPVSNVSFLSLHRYHHVLNQY